MTRGAKLCSKIVFNIFQCQDSTTALSDVDQTASVHSSAAVGMLHHILLQLRKGQRSNQHFTGCPKILTLPQDFVCGEPSLQRVDNS